MERRKHVNQMTPQEITLLKSKFRNIKEITTSEVTDGIKNDVRKNSLNLTNFEFNKFARNRANAVVTGTVPSVKKVVLASAFQNILSFNACE